MELVLDRLADPAHRRLRDRRLGAERLGEAGLDVTDRQAADEAGDDEGNPARCEVAVAVARSGPGVVRGLDGHHRSWPIVGSTADVGGVGGPVATGDALPLDCDADVDAEHPREDGGRQLGRELEQRRRASRTGRDPERTESLNEPAGADRSTGLSAGEEPRR